MTAAFKYETAAHLVSDTFFCVQTKPAFPPETEKAFKAPLCGCSGLCSLCFHLSLFTEKEWDEIFLNSNYLAAIRHVHGLMGDCGAPCSAVRLEGRGGWLVTERWGQQLTSWGGEQAKTGRVVLRVSFLSPSPSHCFQPSPSRMEETDLALVPLAAEPQKQ